MLCHFSVSAHMDSLCEPEKAMERAVVGVSSAENRPKTQNAWTTYTEVLSSAREGLAETLQR